MRVNTKLNSEELVAVNHLENDACEQHLIKIVTLRAIAQVRASIGASLETEN
jgi:hypothetical protein